MIKKMCALISVCGLLALAVAPTLAQDKMGGGKMADHKMGDKMAGHKMSGKMSGHTKRHTTMHRKRHSHHSGMASTMSHGKMSGSKMGGKMSGDKMGGSKMSGGKSGKM